MDYMCLGFLRYLSTVNVKAGKCSKGELTRVFEDKEQEWL